MATAWVPQFRAALNACDGLVRQLPNGAIGKRGSRIDARRLVGEPSSVTCLTPRRAARSMRREWAIWPDGNRSARARRRRNAASWTATPSHENTAIWHFHETRKEARLAPGFDVTWPGCPK